MKAVHPPQPNPHRGYSYVGQEILSMSQGSGNSVKDKEAVGDLKVIRSYFKYLSGRLIGSKGDI